MNWFNYLQNFSLQSYFNELDLSETEVIFVGGDEKQRKKISIELSAKKYLILIERAIELEINDGANVSDSEIDIVVLHAAQVQCAIYQKNTMIAQRRYRVFLTESSSFTCSALLLDNASTDYSIEIHLMGAAASAHFTGLALFKGTCLTTITTKQIHHAVHTTSHLLFKSAVFDQAVMHYNGTVVIEERALHSCASQYNKTILCSEKAQATALPSLEVKTNEVRCQHGSALGQLDQQQVWYLQSRGFSKKQAASLLLQAFFAEKNMLLTEDVKKDVKLKIDELV